MQGKHIVGKDASFGPRITRTETVGPMGCFSVFGQAIKKLVMSYLSGFPDFGHLLVHLFLSYKFYAAPSLHSFNPFFTFFSFVPS
jgi:hypothetical protein